MRLRVDGPRALVGEDDPVGVAGDLRGREVVEDVLADQFGVTLERVAVPGGVRLDELDEVAGLEGDAGDLRVQDLLVRPVRVLPAGGDEPVPAAEHPARRVGLPIALAGVHARHEVAVPPDDADPASPLARGGGLGPELVLVAADREAQVELLDRVVAGVGHQVVDGVHRVLAVAAAVRPFVHLEVEPVLALPLVEARVRAEVNPRRVPRRRPLRQRVAQGEDDVVHDPLHLREAREARAGKVGL